MAETAVCVQVNFLATHLKMTTESKKLGSAGILAIGKQPDSTLGSWRCLDLMPLNSWCVSRSLFGSSLLLLEFILFREVLVDQLSAPLKSTENVTTFIFIHSLSLACFPQIYFFIHGDFHFPFILTFGVRGSRICLSFYYYFYNVGSRS